MKSFKLSVTVMKLIGKFELVQEDISFDSLTFMTLAILSLMHGAIGCLWEVDYSSNHEAE